MGLHPPPALIALYIYRVSAPHADFLTVLPKGPSCCWPRFKPRYEKTIDDKMVVTTGNCSTAVGCSETFLHKHSLAGSVVFLAIFAILIPVAFALGVCYQTSVFATIIITGLALEVLGYIGRILLAVDDASTQTDFILFLVGTILGPTIISLALFRLLPPIVATYGDGFQAWRSQWHNSVFYAFTAVCAVLQVAGAVMATVPTDANTVSPEQDGTEERILTSPRLILEYVFSWLDLPYTCRASSCSRSSGCALLLRCTSERIYSTQAS